MEHFQNIKQCRVCGSSTLTDTIALGPQYLSQGFVKSNATGGAAQIQVPLTLVLCDKEKNAQGCGLLQLKETTEPDLLYRNYFYRSATNDTMRADLREVVDDALGEVKISAGDYVVDIGANDGTMLSYFPSTLMRIGVEPARNIKREGLDPSIRFVPEYFSQEALHDLLHGEKVKIFTSCAMFYDINEPNAFVRDIQSMLAPDGVWCIQLSYLALMLRNMNFYDICHEHLEYYSLSTLDALMQRHGLGIFHAKPNHVNGGSVRVFIAHNKNLRQRTKELEQLLKEEEEMHLYDPETYRAFYQKMQDLADLVRGYILNEVQNGSLVIGLGASTKGNVLLQFFGITKDIMPYIADINPEKISLRTLGTDIEIISDERAAELRPICKVVLPWYFKKEIVKREEMYLKGGGKLLFPMPYPHLVTKDGEVPLSSMESLKKVDIVSP